MDDTLYLFLCDVLARKRKENVVLQFRLQLSIIKDIHCGVILIDMMNVHNISYDSKNATRKKEKN
jgi:hypothetical protein